MRLLLIKSFIAQLFMNTLFSLSEVTKRTIGDVPVNFVRWHKDRIQTAMGRSVAFWDSEDFVVLGLPQLMTSNFLPYEGTPWQMWSGMLGMGVLFRFSKNGQIFSGSYARRDHITDWESYLAKYMSQDELASYNRYLRRYEYFFTQIDYSFFLMENFFIAIVSNSRIYFKILNPEKPRHLKAYWGSQLQLSYLYKDLRFPINLYFEYFWMDYANYLSAFLQKYRNPPNYGFGMEVGISWPFSYYQFLQFTVGYRSAPGRHFDFVEKISGIDLSLAMHTYLQRKN